MPYTLIETTLPLSFTGQPKLRRPTLHYHSLPPHVKYKYLNITTKISFKNFKFGRWMWVRPLKDPLANKESAL